MKGLEYDKLIMMRHGRPGSNGGLSEEGKAQVITVSKLLRPFFGNEMGIVPFSAPSRRAVETLFAFQEGTELFEHARKVFTSLSLEGYAAPHFVDAVKFVNGFISQGDVCYIATHLDTLKMFPQWLLNKDYEQCQFGYAGGFYVDLRTGESKKFSHEGIVDW